MPYRRTRQLVLSGVAVVLLAPVQAQAVDSKVEEMIVTSSRIPVPRRQVGTSVSVITEAVINAHGNLSLVDVMRQMPAVGSSSYGGPGQTTTMRIRGEEGFRTQAIVDGMRLSDPSAPQISTSMEHLLSTGIGRVEILRGPQGLSYGADAGGVVNISSVQVDEGIRGDVDLQIGEFDTVRKTANVGAAWKRGDAFLSVTDVETGGFNTRTDDTVLMDADGYENTTMHFRGGLNVTEQLRLGLVYRDVEGETQYDGCGFPVVYDCLGINDQQAARVSLEYTGEHFTHSVSYAETDTFRDNLTEGVSAFTAEGELKRVEYTGTATHLPGVDLVFGLDHEEDVIGDTGRDNDGAYLELLSDFSENLFLTAGIRYDDNDDFGTNNSYRVTGAYLFDLDNGAAVKLRSSYGTGFRAPSPYEIEYNKGLFAYPPASLVTLQQETSEGYEFGIEYFGANNSRLEAVYFDQDVEEAIYFDLDTFSGYLQDAGESTSRGLELIGELPVTQSIRLSANYTYNDAERPDGTRRLRRPRHLLNLGASWYALQERLNINAFLRASKDSVDSGGPLENFGVLDLTASYKLTEQFQLYGRVENVLDEDYQEVLTYNMPGRTAYLGARYRFTGF